MMSESRKKYVDIDGKEGSVQCFRRVNDFDRRYDPVKALSSKDEDFLRRT